jgi:hypothetical protein
MRPGRGDAGERTAGVESRGGARGDAEGAETCYSSTIVVLQCATV